jgi:hypothetical protein
MQGSDALGPSIQIIRVPPDGGVVGCAAAPA